MRRIIFFAAGMLAVGTLTVSCGAASESAVPTAHAGASPSSAASSVSSSSMLSSSPSASSASSSSSTAQASSSSAPATGGASSSSSSTAAVAPVLAAAVDLGAPVYEPDVPTWPTMACQQSTAGGVPEDGEGSGYTCLFNQSPTSFQYFGVGFQYVKGDSGPTHAIIVCQCNHGGADLGVAKGGTSSEALAWSGSIVVGFGDAADGVTHALYWPNGAGSATILPMPPGIDPHTPSQAHAVNAAGEIVGSYFLAGDPQHVGSRAVLWEPDASAADGSGYVPYDVTSLLPASASGLVLGIAYGIDCTGDVAADGTPAKWQGDPGTAALQNHRYFVLRQGGNGASCSP